MKTLIFKATPAPVRDETVRKANAEARVANEAETQRAMAAGEEPVLLPLANEWSQPPVDQGHLDQLAQVDGVGVVQNNVDHALVRIEEEPLHRREIAVLRLRQIFGKEPEYQGFVTPDN